MAAVCFKVRQLSWFGQMVYSLNVVVYKPWFCLHNWSLYICEKELIAMVSFQLHLLDFSFFFFFFLLLFDNFWQQNIVPFSTAWSELIQLLLIFFSLSCSSLHNLFHPHPYPSANMSLEHNWTVLIKRVVCTKAKSPDNMMFSIRLQLMLLSVIAQLWLKLKTVIMKGIKTEE